MFDIILTRSHVLVIEDEFCCVGTTTRSLQNA